MAVYLYNGVPMKQLPEWDKEKCPYAYLANANLFNFDHYMLRVMDRPGYIYERNGQLILGSEGPPCLAEYIILKSEATTGEWTVYTAETWIDIESELPNVFWSNTDIKKGDGSLWLAASDPIPATNAGLFDLKSWIRGYLLGLSGAPRPFMPLEVEPRYPILAPSDTWYKGMMSKKTFTEINIVDSYIPTGSETETWNADVDDSGSIKCYVDGTTLTIAGNGSGKIALNEDSSYLFSYNGFDMFMNKYWDNVTNINGLQVFDTSKVTSMSNMFSNCHALTSLDLSNFNTVNVTNMMGMFSNCAALTVLDLSIFDTSNVECMEYMFSGCTNLMTIDLSNFNTSNVTDMTDMFSSCNALTSLDLSNFNTSEVTTMFSMFEKCTALTCLNLTNFDTSKVRGMGLMFENCTALTSLDLSSFDTVNVDDMARMFNNCIALSSLDLSNFNTSKVTSMQRMFNNCKALTSLDLSNFDTGEVTDMSYMFDYCSVLTSLDLSNFDTSNVTNMPNMFENCTALTSLDLSNFDTSKVTDMTRMFAFCTELTTIYVGEEWITENALTNDMFTKCGTNTVTLKAS